ncbi:MAG: response regulator [Dehalococcoidales bacterium]|nr:response regulator [Dehalococcoidales bacterium]
MNSGKKPAMTNKAQERNKILVADDDERILQVIRDMLMPNRYEVLLAKDGAEAIEIAQNEQPGLILMDILMPNIDGYTACNAIKSDAKTRHIPIIMLTAVSYELNKKLSERLKADFYLVKPVALDTLLAIIHRFLTPYPLSESF